MTADVATVRQPGDLAAAMAGTATWLWWREDPEAFRPDDDALDELLVASRVPRGGRYPLVVASLLVDEDGAAIGPAVRPDFDHTDEIVAAAEHRLFPVRATGTTSALIHRGAVERHGLPRQRLGVHAGLEWTGRILAGEVGWVAAASVVRRAVAPEIDRTKAMRDLASTVEMVRSGVWGPGQSLVQLSRAGSAVLRPGGGARTIGGGASRRVPE